MSFKIGQKVYCIDDQYGRINGIVTDKTSTSIFIKWDDINEPIEMPDNKIDDIKPIYN